MDKRYIVYMDDSSWPYLEAVFVATLPGERSNSTLELCGGKGGIDNTSALPELSDEDSVVPSE